jgi:hypothetical protein
MYALSIVASHAPMLLGVDAASIASAVQQLFLPTTLGAVSAAISSSAAAAILLSATLSPVSAEPTLYFQLCALLKLTADIV